MHCKGGTAMRLITETTRTTGAGRRLDATSTTATGEGQR